MKSFHSGFALKNEEHFFKNFYAVNEYTVVGFSYGAIKAFEAVCETSQRIDKLILLSPAFFQTKGDKFKKLQIRAYKANADTYLDNFMKACFAPYVTQEVSYGKHSPEDLETLLYYEWDISALKKLHERGVSIEVHLGLSDTIIDVQGARDFFTPLSTVYAYQKANHFLLGA